MTSSNKSSKNAKWYVVHTYSGYENKVKTNLEKIIENRSLEDLIIDIRVPTEDVVEAKGEEKKIVTRKIFPGYVLIKMVMTDDTWYIIRNTTGVTGFVGPGSKPVPLSEEEVEALGVDVREIVAQFNVGDTVKITEGAFVSQTGVVESIDMSARRVTVLVEMFGRKTSLELDINQAEAI
ncbi:MAG: transcription termination/antitermination protein NusG [Clostridia bacterium]|nr:transcription termination/antitermination protein NusG [Clostridia bacterium]MBO7288495.1 transcription termination/antitermination protein NusG [Clostridia bacterium]